MSAKHTPGPWELSHTWVQTADDKKTPIANFNFYAATEENARLIAAAPELLEFVSEYISAWKDGMAGDSYLLRIAEKLHAKATGEAE